jgi:spermidine/putrescine transport system substrate-binding protein
LTCDSQNRRAAIRTIGLAATGLVLPATLVGCSDKTPKKLTNGEAATLHFYSRNVDFGDSVLQAFEARQKLEITLENFAQDEQLFAKLEGSSGGFDLIMPSSATVKRMAAANLLAPLNPALIPNLKNLAPEFRAASFDPAGAFAVPLFWQVLGIGYRKSKVAGTPDSWQAVLDSDAHKGRIALLSDAADMFRLYAKYQGLSAAAMTPADIARIEPMMVKQKPNVQSFNGGSGARLLQKGEADLVIAANGDIARIMADDPDIGFILPREGSLLASANLCVAKGTKHPQNAHALIDYLLDGKSAMALFEANDLPITNAVARTTLGESYTENGVLSPPAERLAKCEFAEFSAELESLFHEAFTRIRAA